MTNQEAINKVINIAKNEIGYLEKRSINNLDSKIENAGSNNYTKYWRDVKSSYQGQPWCACFVTWCLRQSFNEEIAAKLLRHYPYVYCPTLSNLFTLNANPKIGDIVIFKRNGVFVHTGFVINVKGDYFETIEGNTSGGSSIVSNGGGVFKKSYYNSNLLGTKFVTPDWPICKNFISYGTHYGQVYFESLKARGIVTDFNYWENYEAPVEKSCVLAMLDKLAGGFWSSDEDDTSIHWVQPIVISLCGKKIISSKDEWLSNPDACISKALIMALIDKATGGTKQAYVNRNTDHWGRNHLDSLCDKNIINSPKEWTDFEGQVTRANTMALMCKAFGI